MNSFSVKDTVPEKYQPYLAHWQQRKVNKRLRLQARHKEGLEQAKKLAALLKSEFSVEKVALFGSMLSAETTHLHSDIDLAVWGLSLENYCAAMGELIVNSQEFDVDLVRVEDVPDGLKTHILEEGSLL